MSSGGARSGAGRPPLRGAAATKLVAFRATQSELDQLAQIQEHRGELASDVLRGLVAEEAARLLFAAPAERSELDRLKAFEGRVAKLVGARMTAAQIQARLADAFDILNDGR